MRRQVAVWTLILVPLAVAAADEGKEFAPKNMMFTAAMPEGDKSAQKTKVLTIGKHKVPSNKRRAL
jgi:hypothetical protein